MSLGNLNEGLKNIKLTKTYYKNAYQYALKSDDKLIEGFSLFNLARLNYYDGDFTEAKKNIYKGLNIFKENGNNICLNFLLQKFSFSAFR